MNAPFYWDLNVTVVGGQGSATLTKTGRIERTVVNGPAGATYGLAVADKDGLPITGRNNSDGSQLVFVEEYDALTRTVFAISGASQDGAYPVRVWRKDGANFR